MKHQMEYLIKEATDRVAEDGRAADLGDLMLAAFGYLADTIQRPPWYSIKRLVPVSIAAGGAFAAGIIGAFVKWVQ